MNQQLSQDRAQSVLDALRTRRVLTASYRRAAMARLSPSPTTTPKMDARRTAASNFTLIKAEPEPEAEGDSNGEAARNRAGPDAAIEAGEP